MTHLLYLVEMLPLISEEVKEIEPNDGNKDAHETKDSPIAIRKVKNAFLLGDSEEEINIESQVIHWGIKYEGCVN